MPAPQPLPPPPPAPPQLPAAISASAQSGAVSKAGMASTILTSGQGAPGGQYQQKTLLGS